ncbi:MAG: isochorismatase family protein [Proteobacteria bacterium]|nr:isochorismatase family protein [Pseudomonadota bacterium]
MNPAIIVVDMLRDNFKREANLPITSEALRIIPNIKKLLNQGRRMAWPIIFACDSFLEEDFIFGGRMKPHSIRGTKGAEVIQDLTPLARDMVLEKRRFSAFFKTDLDQTLRTLTVDTVVLSGLSTHVCVLMTAMDALSHDFHSIIIEDCCAAHKREVHQAALDLYRNFGLYPLFRILSLEDFLREC